MAFATPGRGRMIVTGDESGDNSWSMTTGKAGPEWISTFQGMAANRAINWVVDPSQLGRDIDATKEYFGKAKDAFGKIPGMGGGGKRPSTRLNARRSSGDDGPNSGGPTGGDGYSSGGGGRRANRSSGGSGGGYGPAGIQPIKTSITFSSGLESGLFVNAKEHTTSEYSSLFIMGGHFMPNYNSEMHSIAAEVVGGDIFWDYLTQAEKKINRVISPHFTKSDLDDYIYHVCKGLQVYYMVDSILTYDSEFQNKNTGMAYLRAKMNNKVIDGHLRLKKTLERQAIPPNLLNFIRYMMQNFAFGEAEHSAIYRLSYSDYLSDSGSNGSAFLAGLAHDSVIEQINASQQANSYLVRAFPEWEVVSMPASTTQVLVDPGFRTFWHNSAIGFMGSSLEVEYSRTVNTEDQKTYYGMAYDNVDGLIYACSSIYVDDATTPRIETGLWQPWKPSNAITETKDRVGLWHYADSRGIVPIDNRSLAVQSGIHAVPIYDTASWVIENVVHSDMQLAQVNTINNMRMATNESVRYLLNPKSLS